MKKRFKLNAFVVAMILIIGGTSLFGKCNKEESNGPYVLTLNSNPSYMLKAYADVNLTTPVADLNKINKDTTIYIVIPKPRAENTAVQVSGADKVADTVATVKMTGNKTITAAYTLDTTNFEYNLNSTSCTVWGYKGTFKNIEIPAMIKGLPVVTISSNSGTRTYFNTLQSVIIPYGVKTIDNVTFYACNNLERATIPNSVTYIGFQAFRDCPKLNHIVIPASIDSIRDVAFFGCYSLTDVRVEATRPPVLISSIQGGIVYYSIFATRNNAPELTISVPSVSLDPYKQAWTNDKLLNDTDGTPGGRTSVKWVGY